MSTRGRKRLPGREYQTQFITTIGKRFSDQGRCLIPRGMDNRAPDKGERAPVARCFGGVATCATSRAPRHPRSERSLNERFPAEKDVSRLRIRRLRCQVPARRTAASIKLHLSAGFRVVGTRERLGCMNGVWRDVVLMERRSKVVGVCQSPNFLGGLTCL